MFFQDMTAAQIKSKNKARKIGHVFYEWALFGHAVYAYIFWSELGASFWILVCGSIFYTISEFFFRKRAERATHD